MINLLSSLVSEGVLKTLAIIAAILVGILLICVIIYLLNQFFTKREPKAKKEKAESNVADDMPAQQVAAYTPTAFGYEKREDDNAIVMSSFADAAKYDADQKYDAEKASAEKAAIKPEKNDDVFTKLENPEEAKPFAYDSVQERKDRVYEMLNKDNEKNNSKDIKNFFAGLDDDDDAAVKPFEQTTAKEKDKAASSSDPKFNPAGFFSDDEEYSALPVYKAAAEKAKARDTVTTSSNDVIALAAPAGMNEFVTETSTADNIENDTSDVLASTSAETDRNQDRFDRILELLNKNAEKEQQSSPGIEKDLIESITREQISEMLKVQADERSAELSKMQKEMQELKDKLASEKDKQGEAYAQLAVAHDEKQEQITREKDDIAALKRELENERAALAREREQSKADFEKVRAQLIAEQQAHEEQLAAKAAKERAELEKRAVLEKEQSARDELASLQKEMQELKEKMEAEKNKDSDNYARLVVAKNEKEEQIETKVAREKEEVIVALKRELEQQRDAFIRERNTEKAELEKIRAQMIEEQRIEKDRLAKAELERAEAAKRAEFEREMEKRLNEIETMKRELEQERARMTSAPVSKSETFISEKTNVRTTDAQTELINELQKQVSELKHTIEQDKRDSENFDKLAVEKSEKEKHASDEKAELVELKKQIEREKAELKAELKRELEREKAEIDSKRAANEAELEKERLRVQAELEQERFEALKKIKQQYALYQNEIERQNKESAERIMTEREIKNQEQTVAANEVFERMQAEINALREQFKNANKTASAKTEETIVNAQTSELTRLINELIEERKHAREEAQILRDELEAESLDSQKKLEEQFELIRSEIERNREDAYAVEQDKVLTEEINELTIKERVEKERKQIMEALKREHEENEKVLREKYDTLKQQLEQQNREIIRKNEEAEKQLKTQYDTFKVSIAQEARALAVKNEELLRELEEVKEQNRQAQETHASDVIATERARLQEQIQAEYEENERLLSEKYLQLRTELQRESKQLAEKSAEVKQEMEEIKQARAALAAQNDNVRIELEAERARLTAELNTMRAEIERTKREQLLANDLDESERKLLEQERERIKADLEREYNESERTLKEKYNEMQTQLVREEEEIRKRQQELVLKEQQISTESIRIKQESAQVTNLITEKTYTIEERNRILDDYRAKIDVLRDRLKSNEKAIRSNKKYYVQLRRIKDTMERDLKLLRKREAIVAKQQVLVYGVNNITDLDPERIKKLEQDVQQLTGLQQSVANCEDIMHKNKDRYPTLENLDKILKNQSKQLLSDIDEIQAAIEFFESYVEVK